MPSSRSTRRAFGFGLAALPLASASAFAQATPTAPQPQADPLGLTTQILATPAADLVQRLTTAPLGPSEYLMLQQFSPNAWADPINSGLATGALGAVLWTRFGGDVANQDDVLGGCIVMPDAAGASGSHQAYLNQASANGRTIVPTQFAGLIGFAAFDSSHYADTLASIGNLVIFAADIFLAEGARTNPASSILRATNHAVAILDHIASLTRTQDTA